MRRHARLGLVSILFATLTFFPTMAGGKGRAGIAPDLADALQQGSPSNRIRLILSLKGADPAYVASRVEELGGAVRGYFPHVDHMLVVLPLESVTTLSEVEGVDYLSPDRAVKGVASHLEVATGASLVYPTSSGAGAASGVDGSGITVAVVDSGINPDLDDLRDGATHSVILAIDFTGAGGLNDPFGHGTHIAGIIAGDGSASRAVGLDYAGMAPRAKLINFKVLDDKGHGYVSNVVAAIDRAILLRPLYNIRVINLSLAAPPVDSFVNDPLCKAVDRATKAGIVVVASAGNFGMDPYGNTVFGGIASPGISPAAITVGATDTRQTNARSDDRVARYSSRGPTLSHTTDPTTGIVTYDDLVKPDLVAPGHRIVSLERQNNAIVTAYPFLHVPTANDANWRDRYMVLYGTSMSAGVVSGAVALMLQANPGLTPNLVKAILMYTAQIMEGPNLFEQGAGMLNVEGAVRLAQALKSSTYSLAAGQRLSQGGLPAAQSTIAGETFVWSQSLIWGRGELTGTALFTIQQAAYSQSLIWGLGAASWGPGVIYSDGLFSDGYVLFGKGGQWVYLTSGTGTTLSSGLLWRDALYASGAVWQNQIISNDFFNVGSTSLIWGYAGYGLNGLSLIWGYGGYDSSLIWGF